MQSMAIKDVIHKLGEGATPSAVEVGRLSGLSRGDVADFLGGWLALAPERRRAILEVAIQLAENDVQMDFGAVFKACLPDPDARVRAAAIEGLWEDDEFRTADQLARILRQDPDPAVREAAALGLARFATMVEEGTLYAPAGKRVRDALFASANDGQESVDVRRRVLEALGVLSEPVVADMIAAAYADADPGMRASAVYAMGRSVDERWLPTILHELESESPELRFEAARAAGQLASARAVVPLITLLDDPDLEVKLAAVGALGEVGGDVARKALLQCARSKDPAIRDAAAEALGQIDLETSPLTISPFLNDSTPTV
jgi:HEAT repeat protein